MVSGNSICRSGILLVAGLASSLCVSHAWAAEPTAAPIEPVSTAQDSTRSSDSRWIPNLALQTGILVHERDGITASVERGVSEGDTRAVFGFGGLSTELATPRFYFLPARPRLFAHFDVLLTRDNDEAVTHESKPGDPLNDTARGLENLDPVPAILGVGSSFRVQSEPVVLSGGMGLSFETDWDGRTIRIKPSIEWMFQRDEMRLSFGDAETVGIEPAQCAPCRATSGRTQTTEGYHSLGPGIEVDMDAGRMGNFMISFFTQFHALAVLGDREVNLALTTAWYTRTVVKTGSNRVITGTSPAVGRQNTTVRSRYRREAWGYKAAAGVRIYWQPE